MPPKDSRVPTADPEDQAEAQSATRTQMDSDSDEFDVDVNERYARGLDKPDSEDDPAADRQNPDFKLKKRRTVETATGDDLADPSQRGRAVGSEPSRKPRVQTKEMETQADSDGLGTADWSSWDVKKSLRFLKADASPLLRRKVLVRLHKRW